MFGRARRLKFQTRASGIPPISNRDAGESRNGSAEPVAASGGHFNACLTQQACVRLNAGVVRPLYRLPGMNFSGVSRETCMGSHLHSYDPSTEISFNSGRSPTVAYQVDHSGRYACPHCGQHGLLRIRRRFVDRLLSLFVRQRRFRCTHSGCQWEGNLRERKPD